MKIPAIGEIHIWLMDCEIFSAKDQSLNLSFLSKEELTKANNFKFKQHREEFLASHGYLRLILSQYLNCCPSVIQYNVGKYGKPFVKRQINPYKLCFNMSHSQGLALYAITSDVEVGVDIEMIKPDINISELVDHIFTPHEKAIFERIEEEKKLKIFYDIWTRKEAYLKATGKGLNFPPNKLEVTVHPNQPTKLISINEDQQCASSWSIYSLSVPKYSVAIAIEQNKNKLRYIHWPDW